MKITNPAPTRPHSLPSLHVGFTCTDMNWAYVNVEFLNLKI